MEIMEPMAEAHMDIKSVVLHLVDQHLQPHLEVDRMVMNSMAVVHTVPQESHPRTDSNLKDRNMAEVHFTEQGRVAIIACDLNLRTLDRLEGRN